MKTTKYFCERCGSQGVAIIQNGCLIRGECSECGYTKLAVGSDELFDPNYGILKSSDQLDFIEIMMSEDDDLC